MGVLLLLSAVALASAEPATTPAAAGRSAAILANSLVSNLLVAPGFDLTCVAAALETCSPVHAPAPSPAPSPGPVPPQHQPIEQEARELLQEVRQVVSHYENRSRNCKDLQDAGDTGKGLRNVYPYSSEPHRRVQVYCDHTIDGGGWTVFQRRTNDTQREDFYRTWADYMLGFGNMEGEFWLGLELIHEITSVTLMELRIDLADYEGGERVAKYGSFYVSPLSDKYRLSVSRYSGDAGDSLIEPGHTGSLFSAYDVDRDNHETNCAERYRGGWWYNKCHSANLNGFQYEGAHTSNKAEGIHWYTWRGHNYSLRKTAMMIRPAH